jgi:putative aminopeptidase FrvX
MDSTLQLLQELTEAHGVPGYEAEIRAMVRRHMEPVGIIEQDRIGSLVCRQGEAGPRVMLAAHMDEIGFMVNHIAKEGFLKFLPLGGWWDQVLLGQRVIVKTHKGDLLGVIGAKPPHLLPQDERKKVVEIRDMYIDIGATSKEVVEEAGVRLGDPDICGDVPGIKPEESEVKLGGGPALVLLEARLIPNLRLRDLIIDVAKTLEIPLQFSAGLGGATDGGQIHLHGKGVPTAVLGVPCRHIHCHAGIMHRDDFDHALRLLVAVIERLDADTVVGLIP